MSSRKLLIVGIGPYAYMHHLPLIKNAGIELTTLIELESALPRSAAILKQFDFNDTQLVGIPSSIGGYSRKIHELLYNDLSRVLLESKITDVIISTEASAHYAYIDFFSNFKLRCYVDKPVFSFHSRKESLEYFADFLRLKQKVESNSSFELHIGLDKRVHGSYNFLREQIEFFAKKFEIVPQLIEISSCDGEWSLPHEFLDRANHPYKYAYGKLLHSGIHYVDLLSSLLQASSACKSFSPTAYDLYVSTLHPEEINQMRGHDFLKKIFPNSEAYKPLNSNSIENTEWGEVDIHSQYTFYSNNKKTTLASVNLTSSGYSNRNHTQSEWNAYMKHGRVKHDMVNVQIGPLANIKLIDYQSKKGIIDGRFASDVPVSEILIFRNEKILGLPAFERFNIRDEKIFTRKDQLQYFLEGSEPRTNLQELTPTMNFIQHNYSAIYSELVESDTPLLTKIPLQI